MHPFESKPLVLDDRFVLNKSLPSVQKKNPS